MYIKQLQVAEFQNYSKAHLEFSKGINCFAGPNGSGKTNLMYAIHMLCTVKSPGAAPESEHKKWGSTYFMLKGIFQAEQEEDTILFSIPEDGKKILKKNGIPYSKLSEHIGTYPCVWISPNDTDLIRNGPDERRRFFDSLLSQADPSYLFDLLQYQQLLKERNSLLKKWMEQGKLDKDLLEIYDNKFIVLCKSLAKVRSTFSNQLLPLFTSYYQFLSEEKENMHWYYQTDVLDDQFDKKFKQNLSEDYRLQRTVLGIHRDEYPFCINDQALKKFGSQGQQKTFVIALKLATLELIEQKRGISPILLLDDIFDKLDVMRMKKLYERVQHPPFSQVFLTDTDPERCKNLLSDSTSIPYAFFYIHDGELEKVF